MTEKLEKFEHWFFLLALAVLFLRPDCFDFRLAGLKISLSSVRNILLVLCALFAYRNLLLWFGREREFSFSRLTPAGLAFCGFFFFACLSVALSGDVPRSLGAFEVLCVYVLFYFLVREHADTAFVLKALAFLSCAAAVTALLWRFGADAGRGDVIEAFPFWPGKNAHGLFFAMCAVLFAGLVLGQGTDARERDKENRKLWIMAAALDFSAMLFSYSRGSWIAFACGMLFVFLRSRRGRAACVIASAAGTALILAALVLAFPDSGLSRRVLRSTPSRDVGVSERLDIWKGTFRLIADRPLAGAGLGCFYHVYHFAYRSGGSRYDWKDTQYHAHNLFLQVTAETGLGGGLCFALFLFLALGRVFRAGPGSGFTRALAAPLAVFCVYSLFDSSFNARFSHASMFHVTLVAVLFLALAVRGADAEGKAGAGDG